MRGWLFGLLAVILSGCGLITADRPVVQQGNVLTADDLSQVEPGLSRARVRELLGNPVLQPTMRPDRWDYVYSRTEGGTEVSDPQRLTLFFEGDRVARVENDYEPPNPKPLTPENDTPPPEPSQPAPAPAEGPPQPQTPGPSGPDVP